MLHFLDADWPEAMEPTKKKLKRSDDQAPCSDGDYFAQGKDEWSPQYELETKTQNLKEHESVAEFDRQTDSLLQSCDIEMQKNEDFPQVSDLLETSLVTGAKCSSFINMGNSDADSLFLSSEWSPMSSMPPSATKWESDYQKGSLRLERMPDPEYFFSAANSIKFDHEVVPQMHCREICTDSFTDIQNCSQSDGKKCKSSWGHADNVGVEEYSIRKDKFSYRDDSQINFGKRMSRRSHSAPPFHREKKRFISLSCRSDTKLKNSNPSGSYLWSFFRCGYFATAVVLVLGMR